MANQKHLEILKKGVEEWNAWREENPEVRPDLNGADLRRADLRFADLRGVYLGFADLSNVELRDADLSGAELSRAELSRADLRGANLSEAKFGDADLRGADLSGAMLTNANLRKADLCGADLSCAELIAANLFGADLKDADCSNAELSFADLRGTDLSDANLSDADLFRADLSGTDLSNADLSKATLQFTTVADLDLREVHGLETILHKGKSDLATSTMARSKGQIPEVFLKGCGLQDWEIAAAKLHNPDLIPQQVTDLVYEIDRIRGDSPIKVNPLFISYSRTDSDFVDALETKLDEKRIRFWRDIHDMKAGPIEEQIERAIEVNQILLLVLSKSSVESDWVEYEVIRARELAKEHKEHVLCPITIDDAWKSCPWDGRLRVQVEKYNILDFSEWQDEAALGTAFQKLIDGLGLFYKPSQQA